jgi:hypothetical protein
MSGLPDNARPAGMTAWPFVVGGVLLAFVAVVIGTGIWSRFQRVDLVSPDYYRMELHHGEQMRRAARGDGVELEQAKDSLTIRFPAESAAGLQGTATFYRPSDASLDFEAPLKPDHAGAQVFDTRSLRPGLWKLRIAWTTGGVEHFREEAITVMEQKERP